MSADGLKASAATDARASVATAPGPMRDATAELASPISILITALGGEGGGVLAEWLVETAAHCGHSVQSTSIPGVAQRTGATTYYVEVFPLPDARLDGRRPVFSLNPVPGALDLLVSSELLETARQVSNGMATPDRTHIVTSTSRALTVAEKMPLGDGRLDVAALLGIVREQSREAEAIDMAAIARDSGTVISAVLFGAIAASGALPFAREAYEETIGRSERGAAASRRGFAAAFAAVGGLRAERRAVAEAAAAVTASAAAAAAAANVAAVRTATTTRATPSAKASVLLDPKTTARLDAFPADVQELAALGVARLEDYQDAAYAMLYLERLDRVLAAERAGREAGKGGDPVAGAARRGSAAAPGLSRTSAPVATSDAASGHATSRETARFLALWMAFDDVVRVADLKSRASRFERVRREVAAGPGDVLAVIDHFKPGIAELAGLLPKPLAERLLRREAARVAMGRDPFALPLKIRTHTAFGLLILRGLAAMKALRRRGSRFAQEQAMIDRWLGAVESGARRDAALGFELAACGRLIKGYGTTNERGKANLLHVIDHLASIASFASDTERAAAIRAARAAALADDSGTALDQALRRHGAPPRPLRAQPIRWVASRPGRAPSGAGRSADRPV